MASYVTLPGSSGGIVTVQSGSGDHLFVAQIIANSILTASVGGTLNAPATVTINGGTPTTVAPPTGPDANSILYLYGSGGGTFTIPTGYNYVVDLMTGPETIIGSNVSLVSYDSVSSTYDLSGSSNLALDPVENDVVTVVSGTGFNAATGSGNDTITAIGTGTVDGGAGANLFTIAPTGPGGIRVQSEGLGDTVNVITGTVATVVSSGNDMDLTTNGIVTVDALLLGGTTGSSVTSGAGTTDVSAGGSDAAIVGGTGTLSVVDSGTSDTIDAASSSAASVTAMGTAALIFGGANTVDVSLSGTGAQGHDTVIGADGASSVTSTGADNVILAGNGDLTLLDNGTTDTVAGFGSSTVGGTLGGSGNLLFAFSGTTNVTVDGTADTIVAGSGPATITAETGAAVFGGTGTLYFIGGGGTSSVLGATGGTEQISVGSGGLLFNTGTDNTSSILGGIGQTTILGGSGSTVLFSSLSGGVGFEFLAGSGNESLNAAGSETNNDFGFFANVMSLSGGAHDTMGGWTANDTLYLEGYSPSQVSIASAAGNVTFNLTNGATITFTDATTSEFNGRVIY